MKRRVLSSACMSCGLAAAKVFRSARIDRRQEPRIKQIEYVLLTALTGAVAAAFGGLMCPALSNLASVFTSIAQALQGHP